MWKNESTRLNLDEIASGTSARVLNNSRLCVGTHGTTTSKGLNSKFLDCQFHVNPGGTRCCCWRRYDKHVSSTNDALGKECTPETYLHLIIFIGMMNELAVTDKPHRSDEPNLEKAKMIRDYAESCMPGYWSSSVQVQTALGNSTRTRR